MTKILFLICLILCYVPVVSAQQSSASMVAIDASLGYPLLLAKGIGLDGISIAEQKTYPSYSATLGIRYARRATGSLVNQMGLHVSGGKVNVNEGVYELSFANLSGRFGYGYEIAVASRAWLVPSVGVGMGYFLHIDDGLKEWTKLDAYSWRPEYDDRFRRFQPTANAGFSLKLDRRRPLEIGMSYSQYITKVYKDSFSAFHIYNEMKDVKLSGLELRLGVGL